MKRLLSIFLVLSFLLQGCASMFCGGSKQALYVESTPSGADVTYHKPTGKDKEEATAVGKTPVVVNVPKRKAGIIEIQKEGYNPISVNLTKKVEGWFWGNFLWLLIWPVCPVAFLVDGISGSMFEVHPDKINVNLEEAS